MTKISNDVERETPVLIGERVLLARITKHGVGLRLKNSREWLSIDYASLWAYLAPKPVQRKTPPTPQAGKPAASSEEDFGTNGPIEGDGQAEEAIAMLEEIIESGVAENWAGGALDTVKDIHEKAHRYGGYSAGQQRAIENIGKAALRILKERVKDAESIADLEHFRDF